MMETPAPEVDEAFLYYYFSATKKEWREFSYEVALAIEQTALSHAPTILHAMFSSSQSSLDPKLVDLYRNSVYASGSMHIGKPEEMPLVRINSATGALDPTGDIGVDLSGSHFCLRTCSPDDVIETREVRRVPDCVESLLQFQTARELRQATKLVDMTSQLYYYDQLVQKLTSKPEPSDEEHRNQPSKPKFGGSPKGGKSLKNDDLLHLKFKKKGKGVRFGSVHVREMLGKVEVEAGREKLRLDWKVLGDTRFSSVDSFERRREHEGRVERGEMGNPLSDMVLKSRGAQAITRRRSLGTEVEMMEDESSLVGAAEETDAIMAVEHWYPLSSRVDPSDPRSEACLRLCIEGKDKTTSPVVACENRLVKTARGSNYYLGTLSPRLEEALTMLGIEFTEDAPLANINPMFYATNLLFVIPVRDKARSCVKVLHDLQEALGFADLTSPHFTQIFQVLERLGITPRLLW